MNTETQIVPQGNKQSALAVMAERCQVEPGKLHTTLKDTVFKGASDSEMLALVVVANQYALNPLLKEMYAFPQKGGGIVPVVGIDGWLSIINRQKNFDGMDVKVYPLEGTKPTHAECKIYTKDRQHPVAVTEYYDECFRPTEPWKQMPRRMLRHKAIMQAARVAFGLSGIFDEDEARDTMRNVTPKRERQEVKFEPVETEVEALGVEVVDPKPEPQTEKPKATGPKSRLALMGELKKKAAAKGQNFMDLLDPETATKDEIRTAIESLEKEEVAS